MTNPAAVELGRLGGLADVLGQSHAVKGNGRWRVGFDYFTVEQLEAA